MRPQNLNKTKLGLQKAAGIMQMIYGIFLSIGAGITLIISLFLSSAVNSVGSSLSGLGDIFGSEGLGDIFGGLGGVASLLSGALLIIPIFLFALCITITVLGNKMKETAVNELFYANPLDPMAKKPIDDRFVITIVCTVINLAVFGLTVSIFFLASILPFAAAITAGISIFLKHPANTADSIEKYKKEFAEEQARQERIRREREAARLKAEEDERKAREDASKTQQQMQQFMMMSMMGQVKNNMNQMPEQQSFNQMPNGQFYGQNPNVQAVSQTPKAQTVNQAVDTQENARSANTSTDS
jgi:hypothetical protein